MSQHKASLGADPELFITRNGEEVPVFGLVGGSKQEPVVVKKNPYGTGEIRYLEDNAALEFNIPVSMMAESFYSIMDSCMAFILSLLQTKGLDANKKCQMTLAPRYMQDPRAQEMGCVEDFLSYGPNASLARIKRMPIRPVDIMDKRFAGGHLHVGYNFDLVPRFIAARMLDLFVGLACVGEDKQEIRRLHYGLASLHRDTAYGIEYRQLSNFWIFKSGDFKYRLAQNVFHFANPTVAPKGQKRFQEKLMEMNNYVPWTEVQEAINTENEKLAAQLLTHVNERYDLNIYSLKGVA